MKTHTYDWDKMVDWRIDGLLTEEDEDLMLDASSRNNHEVLQELFDKYSKPEDIPDDPEPEPKDTKKAVLAYRSVSRMLRFQLLKEEVLLEHNHTCICCDTAFPTRTDWKKKDRYPLYVRCNFPLVKYIEHLDQYDPKVLATDEKIFNKDHYTAICDQCKPLSFSSKKKK